MSSFDEAPRAPRERNLVIPSSGPFVAFITNLDWNTNEDQLANHFIQNECKVVDVKMMTDRETGKPNGRAHLYFEDAASLEQSLLGHDSELGARRIRVEVNKPKDRDGGFQRGGDRVPDRGYGSSDRGDRGDRRGGNGDERGNRDGYNRGGDRGGDREREQSDQDRDWTRRAAPAPAHHREPALPAANEEPLPLLTFSGISTEPGKRPTIVINSRSVSAEQVGAVSSKPSIFGDGKPANTQAWEVNKLFIFPNFHPIFNAFLFFLVNLF